MRKYNSSWLFALRQTPDAPTGAPSEAPATPPTVAPLSAPSTPTPGTPPVDGAPAPTSTPPAEGDSPSALSSAEGEAPAPESEVPLLSFDDLKLPEGFEVDEETQKNFVDLLNDKEISSLDRTQKLVDLHTSLSEKIVAATHEAGQKAWTDMQTQWQEELRNDPKIGGEHLAKNLAEVKKGLVSAGADKAFFDAMNLTGAGNNPAIVRVLHALTKPQNEGGEVASQPTGRPMNIEERALTMYPSMQPKE